MKWDEGPGLPSSPAPTPGWASRGPGCPQPTGARVVLAVRNVENGNAAASRIIGVCPRADVAVAPLDLASLQSVRTAAAELRAANPRIELLINNAGVMYTPKQTTEDGFELQLELAQPSPASLLRSGSPVTMSEMVTSGRFSPAISDDPRTSCTMSATVALMWSPRARSSVP